jgi:hypothetical protein
MKEGISEELRLKLHGEAQMTQTLTHTAQRGLEATLPGVANGFRKELATGGRIV